MNIPAFMPLQLILNYHRVSDNIQPESHFSIHPDTLRKHFEIIRDHKTIVTATNEYERSLKFSFSVALSFDDGNLSDFDIVRPLLAEFGFSASFFPIIHHVGLRERMNWQQIKDLAARGYSIGSHSLSHDIMIKQSIEKQRQEMQESKSILENNIGNPVTQFAFPFGRHDEHLLDLCRESGFSQALTTGLKVNKLKEDKFLLFRWNITSKTDINLFKQVITSSGNVSPALEMSSRLNSFMRDTTGTNLK